MAVSAGVKQHTTNAQSLLRNNQQRPEKKASKYLPKPWGRLGQRGVKLGCPLGEAQTLLQHVPSLQ